MLESGKLNSSIMLHL